MSSEDEPESPRHEDINPGGRILSAIASLFLISRISDSIEDLKAVEWYRLSATAYYLGILGLTGWSVLFGFVFAATRITSSSGVVSGGLRLIGIGPLLIAALWVFAGLARWVGQEINSTHRDNIDSGFTSTIKMSFVSGLAISFVLIIRSILFSTTSKLYDPPLSELQAVTFIFIDLSWISLLLIGVGGLGTIYFAPVE